MTRSKARKVKSGPYSCESCAVYAKRHCGREKHGELTREVRASFGIVPRNPRAGRAGRKPQMEFLEQEIVRLLKDGPMHAGTIRNKLNGVGVGREPG